MCSCNLQCSIIVKYDSCLCLKSWLCIVRAVIEALELQSLLTQFYKTRYNTDAKRHQHSMRAGCKLTLSTGFSSCLMQNRSVPSAPCCIATTLQHRANNLAGQTADVGDRSSQAQSEHLTSMSHTNTHTNNILTVCLCR